MTAYYNEIDPYAAEWICNLAVIKCGETIVITSGYHNEESLYKVLRAEVAESVLCGEQERRRKKERLQSLLRFQESHGDKEHP